MAKQTHVVYVSYDEAQKLIPIFEYYAREGPWKEVRTDALHILRELREVRNRSYAPLSGKQIFLTSSQYEFLNDVRAEVE